MSPDVTLKLLDGISPALRSETWCIGDDDANTPQDKLSPQACETPSSCSSQTIDNDKHPKGKRKRTAARDKLILERAYKNDPKPDKHARLAIVAQVSLSEKEVQIWFQNRRQNDRRKSRPLSREEIVALRLTGVHYMPPLDAIFSGPDAMFLSEVAEARALDRAPMSPQSCHGRIQEQARVCLGNSLDSREGSDRMQERKGRNGLIKLSFPGLERGPSDSLSPHPSSVGFLANRWNIGSSLPSRPIVGSVLDSDGSQKLGSQKLGSQSLGRQNLGHQNPGHQNLGHQNPAPSSSVSDSASAAATPTNVRLSLSLDGKAEVVSGQSSPEGREASRPAVTLAGLSQARRGGFQRSHSTLPLITLPPITTLTRHLPPRLSRGRSRDVAAWESCADSEKRDGLTAQAELESNGSAVAAISLLRSSSGVLQQSTTRRNVAMGKRQEGQRRAFGRASSSYARVENCGAEPVNKYPKVKVSSMLTSPTDSDKENENPDEHGIAYESRRRRLLPNTLPNTSLSRLHGGVVEENQMWKRPRLGGNAAWAPSASRRASGREQIRIFEDASHKESDKDSDPSPWHCDEVERFMRGDVSPSKRGELDCAAGLLSLSKSSWS